MADRCNICCKDLSYIVGAVQADLINDVKNWRTYWENKDYKFYFPEDHKTMCCSCFKAWSSWKIHKKKHKYLIERETTGKKPKLEFPIPTEYDNCVICKQQTEYETTRSKYNRKHYLSGMGQFCPSCYMATANTGIVMREFYQDYLF